MNLSENGADNYDWNADGVYQLEVTDPVQGGPGGIANRQATELAKRTRNLHGRVQTVEANKAPLASPALSGVPTAPTAAPATNTTQLATTAFVKAVIASLGLENMLTANSPSLTGTPTAPTAATSDNSTKIANTAFVKAVVAALVASSPAALDTLNELATALGNDANFAVTMTNALAGKASNADARFADARTPTDLSVTYGKVANSLKIKVTVASAIDLSAAGIGAITLAANTAFTFSGFELNRSYLLKVTANGFTPSFATISKHEFIDGNADLGNAGIFYIFLTCIDATPGSEKLLTGISKGV